MSYRIGFGNYVPTIPCASAKSGLPSSLLGLGCPDCGGTCGQSKGLLGLGIFDSGLDWTQWGLSEWATIAFGAWALMSMFGSAKRAAGAVGALAPTKAGKRKRRKRARAMAEAREAGLF